MIQLQHKLVALLGTTLYVHILAALSFLSRMNEGYNGGYSRVSHGPVSDIMSGWSVMVRIRSYHRSGSCFQFCKEMHILTLYIHMAHMAYLDTH